MLNILLTEFPHSLMIWVLNIRLDKHDRYLIIKIGWNYTKKK